MTYLPVITIIFILLVIISLIIKPFIGKKEDSIHGNELTDNEVTIYFGKLIALEMKFITNSISEKEFLNAKEPYMTKITALLNLNRHYLKSFKDEQKFLFLVKKKNYIKLQIDNIHLQLAQNEIDIQFYEANKAILTNLLNNTEIELTPYIA